MSKKDMRRGSAREVVRLDFCLSEVDAGPHVVLCVLSRMTCGCPYLCSF